MALGTNIDLVGVLKDQIKASNLSKRSDQNQIRVLEDAMIAEVQDAYDNGLGSIPAGFLPNANGRYTIKKGSRVISITWDFDNLTVEKVKVLDPNDVKELVAEL